MSQLFPQNTWSGAKLHDPWWKSEAWRYEHPVVARKYLWRQALPGFGWALGAFSVYCAVEYFSDKSSSGHSAGGVGHSSHSHTATATTPISHTPIDISQQQQHQQQQSSNSKSHSEGHE